MSNIILKYDEFLKETLSVNDDVKVLSEIIFNSLKDKPIGKYKIYDNIPEIFNASEIVINIISKNDKNKKYHGSINVTKSKLKNDKWIIYLDFVEKSDISLYYHELNHALQLIKNGKHNTIKDINNKDGLYAAVSVADNLRFKDMLLVFCEMMYLSSNSEIDSKVSETYASIKDFLSQQSITNHNFINCIKHTEGWKISLELMNFKISDDINNTQLLNKFLCYSEWLENNLNKSRLSDKLPSFLKNIWYSFKMFKYDINQKPKHNIEYYENYINSQGKKLQHKLMKLYGHFNIDSGVNLKDTKI